MGKPVKSCTPVQSYKGLAEHYRLRVHRLAAQAVAAMNAGDLPKAASLYEKGTFAQQNYDHYRLLASCIGDMDFGDDTPLLPSPDEK